MILAICMAPPTQGELRFTIEMCEHYLNYKFHRRTNKQFYERLRRKTLKDLLKLQLKEFGHV